MRVKVLLIRFSSIGDIVLTTPVIRCIKQQLNEGDVDVHFLTKKQFVPLLQSNPYIDSLKTIESKVAEVLPELRDEGYDYIFDLHNNLRSRQVKSDLRTLAFTFRKLNVRKYIYVNTKINVMPDVHIVDRYMDTTKAFGIVNDQKGLDYFIPADEEVDLATLPAPFQRGYIGFAIGGQHEGKMLPVEKIIAICERIPGPVVLLGGPEDAEKGAAIEQAIGQRILNACGRYSINQSASLVKQAEAIITHDTGLMHIASAFKKKIISIWGATVPQFGMSPYLPGEGSRVIEPRNYRDRPYSKLGNRQWYKGPFKGMERIDVNEVIQALNK